MVWSCEKGNGEEDVLRLVEEMEVSGKREVGRPRKTWKDIVKRDLKLIGVTLTLTFAP